MTPPLLSVVIPTLDEEARLPALLDDLAALDMPLEIIVADGGSTDRTLEVAWAGGARVVDAPPGRGGQIRAGAAVARADCFFFLHADTRVPESARRDVETWLRGSPAGGPPAYFRFSLQGTSWYWRILEVGQRLRERLAGLVYGDQGLLVSRTDYEAVGGYPDWPLMEDVGIVDTLRRRGPLLRLGSALPTSPRRYREEGRWRAWTRNVVLMACFRLGASPFRLARWYPPRKAGTPAEGPPRTILLVFAKAPRPGAVKTRLAADVGADAAARIYKHLGRQVVDAVRPGPYRTLVCHAPADAGAEVADWLGNDGLAYMGQSEGDLGHRMARAFDHAFTRADHVCIVGTDAPDVSQELVVRAFAALSRGADMVVGPAADGGYYLLALTRPRASLFGDMPWSTDRVLSLTLERARDAGLVVHTLPVLRDVDTLADVPESLMVLGGHVPG